MTSPSPIKSPYSFTNEYPKEEYPHSMDELKSLMRVSCSVFASLTYCYFLIPKLPRSTLGILFILPIIYLFTALPWQLTSVHLRTLSAFYLVWLCTFKLLLLCFNTGPLSEPITKKSLFKFILIASFPIKLKKDQPPQKPKTQQSNPQILLNLSAKGALLALVIHLYTFKQKIHPTFLLVLYFLNFFLEVELLLGTAAALANTLLGLELEPQFNKPYLSTSLQDFWGRRWDLIVTNILRPTVYEPIRRYFTTVIGKEAAMFMAMLATFLVSGLMHEVLFYYLSAGAEPTWGVTCFFVIHGICMVAEITVRKKFSGIFRLSPAVSGPLTIGFVFMTFSWLLFPAMTRNGAVEKAIAEYHMLAEFFM